MELWIRSQDKTFLTIINSGLFIHEHYDNCHKGLYEITGSYGGVLGLYTKERALEVLDEIQNMIKPTLIHTEYHSEIKQGVNNLEFDVVMNPVEDKITYIQPSVIVYEMPKE